MADDLKTLKRRIDKLEDDLKAAERRVAEIKVERDEATALVERMRQHFEDANRIIESWCEAFDMQQNDDGKWTYAAWVGEREADWQNYLALLKKWNLFVPEYNRLVAPKGIGRPLDASDAQVTQVLKLQGRCLAARHRGGNQSIAANRAAAGAHRSGRVLRGGLRRCAPVPRQ